MRRVYRVNQLKQIMVMLLLTTVLATVPAQTMPEWMRKIYDAYHALKDYVHQGAYGGGGGGGF